MKIAAIDNRQIDRPAAQGLGGVEPSKSAAENYYAMHRTPHFENAVV